MPCIPKQLAHSGWIYYCFHAELIGHFIRGNLDISTPLLLSVRVESMQEPRNGAIVQRLLHSVHSFGGAGGKAFLVTVCYLGKTMLPFSIERTKRGPWQLLPGCYCNATKVPIVYK